MDRTAELTAAFEAGKAAARSTEYGVGFSNRFRYAGKARGFFEAGFHSEEKKMKAEEAAYRASPQFAIDQAEIARKERELLTDVFNAVMKIRAADELARRERAAKYEAFARAAEAAANR
jgi:hypothetical protein